MRTNIYLSLIFVIFLLVTSIASFKPSNSKKGSLSSTSENKKKSSFLSKSKGALLTGAEIAAACLGQFLNALPVNFCTRTNSTTVEFVCPKGYINYDSNERCYTPCPSGLYFDGTSTCQPNPCSGTYQYDNNQGKCCSTIDTTFALGQTVYENCVSKPQSTTASVISYTNSSVTCPATFAHITWENQGAENVPGVSGTKTGCFNDCGNFGMVNCATTLDCGASQTSCGLGELSQFVNELIALAEAVADVVTLGSTVEAFASLKSSITKTAATLSENAISASFKLVQAALNNPSSRNAIFKIVLKNTLISVGEQAATTAVEAVCQSVGYTVGNQTVNAATVGAVDTTFFDLFGISEAVVDCGPSGSGTSCASAILSSVGNFDPTGALSVIASMVPTYCNDL